GDADAAAETVLGCAFDSHRGSEQARKQYNARRVSTEKLFTPRFAALWFFQFATFFAAFQLFPVIPFRILALGGSKAEAGSFLFVYTLSSAFAAPMTGAIAD